MASNFLYVFVFCTVVGGLCIWDCILILCFVIFYFLFYFAFYVNACRFRLDSLITSVIAFLRSGCSSKFLFGCLQLSHQVQSRCMWFLIFMSIPRIYLPKRNCYLFELGPIPNAVPVVFINKWLIM